MACSGLLVALLVAVFIQMAQTSTSVVQESARLRRQEIQRREVRGLLQGLVWHPASLTSQDPWLWQESPGRLVVWSRVSLGHSPGPVRWVFESTREGLNVRSDDPLLGVPPWTVDWNEIQSLRLEVLQSDIREQGEEMRWVELSAWDPSRPLRPLGLRMLIRWKEKGIEECLMRML